MSQNIVYETLKAINELDKTTMRDEIQPGGEQEHFTSWDNLMKSLREHVYSEAYRQDQEPTEMDDLFLHEAFVDLIEMFLNRVDFETLRMEDDEPFDLNEMEGMVYEVARDLAYDCKTSDDATDILREYGLDRAMHRYGDDVISCMFRQHENTRDPTRKRFTGFSVALAHHVIIEYTMACARYIYGEIREVVPPEDDSDDDSDDDEEEVHPSDLAELLVKGNINDFASQCVIGECAICSEITEPCFTLPCKHCFGLRCLSAWTKKKYETGEANTCPMCRAPY